MPLTSSSHDQDDAPVDLYTPAMLADILGVSVRIVRRWHAVGLLRSSAEIMQLPYFDFSQLAAAKRLTRWMEQGATVQSIQRQLRLLRERAENSQVELITIENLPITADGKRLILRSGEHFLEATGQLRFGFEHVEFSSTGEVTPATVLPATVLFDKRRTNQSSRQPQTRRPHECESLSLEQMVDEAIAAEDEDDLACAVDWYRAALSAYGSNANLCFQLAELLYRDGDLAGARERYFMALELDPHLVEARANLGCVLAECGQLELAVAAFEGTLEQYAGYADVHFHLARVLDDLGNSCRAAEHWKQFLELAPASPWAEEAKLRLDQLAPLLDF